jgi:hypothetical protein
MIMIRRPLSFSTAPKQPPISRNKGPSILGNTTIEESNGTHSDTKSLSPSLAIAVGRGDIEQTDASVDSALARKRGRDCSPEAGFEGEGGFSRAADKGMVEEEDEDADFAKPGPSRRDEDVDICESGASKHRAAKAWRPRASENQWHPHLNDSSSDQSEDQSSDGGEERKHWLKARGRKTTGSEISDHYRCVQIRKEKVGFLPGKFIMLTKTSQKPRFISRQWRAVWLM